MTRLISVLSQRRGRGCRALLRKCSIKCLLQSQWSPIPADIVTATPQTWRQQRGRPQLKEVQAGHPLRSVRTPGTTSGKCQSAPHTYHCMTPSAICLQGSRHISRDSVGTDLLELDRGLTEGVGKPDILFNGGHCGRGLEAAHVLAEVGEPGAGGLSALQVLAGQGTCRKGEGGRGG